MKARRTTDPFWRSIEEEGYTDACYIAASIYDEDDEENTSCEAHLQDDGTLTFYESLVFEQEKAEREIHGVRPGVQVL